MAIVLAAGQSRRFGRLDKLSVQLGSRPLVMHAIGNALDSGAQRIIVVGAIAHRTRLQRVLWVRSRRSREGLGASLAVAFARLRPVDREVLVFLGDMPFARAHRGWRLPVGHLAGRPFAHGEPGHPTLLRGRDARRFRPTGDEGLRSLIGQAKIARLTGNRGNVIDVDTADMLRRVRRHGSRTRG